MKTITYLGNYGYVPTSINNYSTEKLLFIIIILSLLLTIVYQSFCWIKNTKHPVENRPSDVPPMKNYFSNIQWD